MLVTCLGGGTPDAADVASWVTALGGQVRVVDPRTAAEADWLYVCGSALLRSDPQRLVETAAVARARGSRVALDLSPAGLVARPGVDAFASLCEALRPSVVFATDAEWAANRASYAPGGHTVLVVKHGGRGASFVIDGVSDDRWVPPGPVVDVSGAGAALAAGYLVGGVDLAMKALACCLAVPGARPRGTA